MEYLRCSNDAGAPLLLLHHLERYSIDVDASLAQVLHKPRCPTEMSPSLT